MLHFAQTAIAFVVAGASVLIVAGLVRETLHDKGRHLHLFPDAHDPPAVPAPEPVAAVAADPASFPNSRGEKARRDKRGRARVHNDGEAARRPTKQRRNKKRDRAAQHEEAGSHTTFAETEDASTPGRPVQ